MHDPACRDADHAAELRELARRDGADLRVVELDATNAIKPDPIAYLRAAGWNPLVHGSDATTVPMVGS